jgi:hypothetical protein
LITAPVVDRHTILLGNPACAWPACAGRCREDAYDLTVPDHDRLGHTREIYLAFAAGDREVLERGLTDEVIVTYAVKHPDRHNGRNTEILTLRGDKACRTDFGWAVP